MGSSRRTGLPAIGVGVVDDFLHHDDVGVVLAYRLNHRLLAVVPAQAVLFVGGQSRDADVACHHAVYAVVALSLFAGFGGAGERQQYTGNYQNPAEHALLSEIDALRFERLLAVS